MADKGNNMVRNIIDCVLVILVIFFGYHFFTNPKSAPVKHKAAVEQTQQRFDDHVNKSEKKKGNNNYIPREMLENSGQ